MKYFIRNFYFILLLGFISSLNAQNISIQQIRKKIESDKYSVHDKIYFSDTLLLYYRKSNPDSALYFAKEVKKYASKVNDTGSIDYANSHIGSIYRIIGKYDSSVFYYYEALKSYQQRKFEDGIASIYNNLATVYKTQGRYDLAIKNYIEALNIFKNTKKYSARANIYSNFAELYFKFENYEKAQYYWKLAESDYLRESSIDLSFVYRGLARIFIHHKNYDNALKEINKALELDIKNQVKVSECEDRLVLIEIGLLNDNQTLYKNNQHLISLIIPSIDIPIVRSKYYELKGDYNVKNKNYSESIIYFDSSKIALQNEHIPEILFRLIKKRIHSLLLTKDFKSISNEYSKMIQLSDEINQLKREWVTQEMEARFSLKEQEEKIKILDEKNKVAYDLVQTERKLKYQSQQQILWMWIGIGLFVVLIIYILFTNKKLQTSQKELQKNIEEKEFLFKELNHRVKNNLHIVGSFLSIESFGKTEEVKEILLSCENRIQSLGLVHEMLYKGEIGETIQLKPYLTKLTDVIKVTLIKDNTIIQTNISDGVYLKSDKAVLLGLIANELITNSIKHAKSINRILVIEINLNILENKTVLSISDNGIGIKEQSSDKSSLGMKLAKGLTRQLNGEFDFKNKSEGVEFKITF